MIIILVADFLQTSCQELGVQAPVGYWDPAGLAKDGDVETFKRRCKHKQNGWMNGDRGECNCKG